MVDSQSTFVAKEIQCAVRPTSVDEIYERGYLAANPDVARAGVKAREHFANYGHEEGRVQWVNEDEVAEMRERKLKRVCFRAEPVVPRGYGQAANYLSSETIDEFAIPETPPIASHFYGGPFIAEIRDNPQKLCLDVGAGLRFTYADNIVNLEIYPSISTDVISIGEELPFEDNQFDYIMCLAVLEHTRKPWEVAREMCRVLKPGGKILVDYPFLQPVHGYPFHYFNATPLGATTLFEKYCEIESSTIPPNQHPIYTLWLLLRNWRSGLSEIDCEQFEDLTFKEILAQQPDQQLGAFYCANLSEEMQRVIAAGSTFVGKKRLAAMSLESSKTTIQRQQQELECAHSEIRDAEELIRALETVLNGVFISKSWRITAPLRAVAHMLRRSTIVINRPHGI